MTISTAIGLAQNLHGSLAAVRAHLTRSSARILSIRDDQERQALQAKCADYEARIADLIAQITAPMPAPIPAPIPAPAKAKPKAKAREVTPSNRRLGAREFWDMHAIAVRAIGNVYGAGWKCRAPLGETVLATVPAGLRSYKTPTGSTIRWFRDHRMPAAQFWHGGVLPAGLILSEDGPAKPNRAHGGTARTADMATTDTPHGQKPRALSPPPTPRTNNKTYKRQHDPIRISIHPGPPRTHSVRGGSPAWCRRSHRSRMGGTFRQPRQPHHSRDRNQATRPDRARSGSARLAL